MANKSLEVMSSINGKRETKWNYVVGILLNSPGLYGHNYVRAKKVISFLQKSVKVSPLVKNIHCLNGRVYFLEQLIQREKIRQVFLHRCFFR